VLIIIWSPLSNWDSPVGRFWGDEHLPDQHIIVFGPRKSTDAPHRPDEEKSDTHVLLD